MAAQRRRSQGIGSVIGGAFAFLGLVGLIASLGNEAWPLSAFLEIALRTALGALSWVISVAWQLLMPCVLGHARLLESLLQATVGGWQLLTVAGAA